MAIYNLKENGLKLVEKVGDTLLAVCAETDELIVYKMVGNPPANGIRYDGHFYIVSDVFTASTVFEKLQDVV